MSVSCCKCGHKHPGIGINRWGIVEPLLQCNCPSESSRVYGDSGRLRHHLDGLSMMVLQGLPIRFLDRNAEHKEVLSRTLVSTSNAHVRKSEKGLTLMTITSVEHPPILIPLLRTVPLHSHVFISRVTTLSPLILFQFLYPRVSIDSPEEPDTTASEVVTSKSCGGKVPEGRASITPSLLVVSFQMNTSWIETPTCRCRETWSFGPSPSLRSRYPTGATS